MDVILPLLAIAVVVVCIVAAVHAMRDDADEAARNKAIFEAGEARRAASRGASHDDRKSVPGEHESDV